jgi:hypothetical protein
MSSVVSLADFRNQSDPDLHFDNAISANQVIEVYGFEPQFVVTTSMVTDIRAWNAQHAQGKTAVLGTGDIKKQLAFFELFQDALHFSLTLTE